jgi:hypothetical protein
MAQWDFTFIVDAPDYYSVADLVVKSIFFIQSSSYCAKSRSFIKSPLLLYCLSGQRRIRRHENNKG